MAGKWGQKRPGGVDAGFDVGAAAAAVATAALCKPAAHFLLLALHA